MPLLPITHLIYIYIYIYIYTRTLQPLGSLIGIDNNGACILQFRIGRSVTPDAKAAAASTCPCPYPPPPPPAAAVVVVVAAAVHPSDGCRGPDCSVIPKSMRRFDRQSERRQHSWVKGRRAASLRKEKKRTKLQVAISQTHRHTHTHTHMHSIAVEQPS